MSESTTSERRLAAIEKQRRALELRKSGVSFPQIAQELGYSGPSSAYGAVQSAIRRVLQEPAEEVVRLELARLDEMLFAVWDAVCGGDTQAIASAIRIMERRAKYLGLDAPTKVDITSLVREEARRAGLSDEDAEAAVAYAASLARELQP